LISDIDLDAVAAVQKKIYDEIRYPAPLTQPSLDFLVGAGLVVGGRPTHACMHLFASKPEHLGPAATAVCARFEGTDRKTPLGDQTTFCGTAIGLAGQIFRALSKTVGDTSAADGLENGHISTDAIAEAVVNAVFHRDYRAAAPILVEIFSTRLEIWNPGTLPDPTVADDPRRLHAARPPNPILAGVARLHRTLRLDGRGLQMIGEHCQATLRAERLDGVDGVRLTLSDLPIPVDVEQPESFDGLKPESQAGEKPESEASLKPESLQARVLALLAEHGALPKAQISTRLHQRRVSGPLNSAIRALLWTDLIEATIPSKPNSRLQRYRVVKRT
jgi:predicted HTH transcriptional regulator